MTEVALEAAGLLTLKRLGLVLSTITMGLSAGLFWAFGYSVMNSLALMDDATFVRVMNKINIQILNPWFMFCWLGGLVFGGVAVLLAGIARDRSALLWTGISFGLYLVAFLITMIASVPLNNALATVGDHADQQTFAAARTAFESAWNRWNVIRAAIHTLAFATACLALLRLRP